MLIFSVFEVWIFEMNRKHRYLNDEARVTHISFANFSAEQSWTMSWKQPKWFAKNWASYLFESHMRLFAIVAALLIRIWRDYHEEMYLFINVQLNMNQTILKFQSEYIDYISYDSLFLQLKEWLFWFRSQSMNIFL